MLVLTRRLGEIIRIGDNTKITVLEVRAGQVKLGIDAPPEVKVHREEIYARIQEAARRATQAKTGELNPGISHPPSIAPPKRRPTLGLVRDDRKIR